MPKKNTKKIIKENKREIYLILNSILSILIIIFAAFLVGTSYTNYYIIFIFLCIMFLATARLLRFFKEKRLSSRFRNFIILILYGINAILTLFIYADFEVYHYAAAFLFLIYFIDSLLKMIGDINYRELLKNILFACICAYFIYLYLSPVFIKDESIDSSIYVITLGFAFIVLAFINLSMSTFNAKRILVLFKIVRKTYVVEVLLCLISLTIAFSLLIPIFEPDITNSGDALWYCFAVITTIGFGDFTCTTLIGRIFTVILGFYGLVVVAIMTSVIVNFYNETSKMEESTEDAVEELKEIEKKNKK